jgi:hypothetical protein
LASKYTTCFEKLAMLWDWCRFCTADCAGTKFRNSVCICVCTTTKFSTTYY